jgi:hypothetical protein
MNQPVDNGDRATVRVDLGLFRICEGITRRAVPQVDLWGHGLGDVTREFFYQQGLPRGPISVVDVAKQLGILRGSD